MLNGKLIIIKYYFIFSVFISFLELEVLNNMQQNAILLFFLNKNIIHVYLSKMLKYYSL